MKFMDEMVLQKDYRNDDKLRASFNELAKKTFALDFEGQGKMRALLENLIDEFS